eukprot:CAMPEP_0185200296 /NCGR_PEP_ID=MMETSP1140-20130426/46995_1 /TAXON_ID=298111 /ORGANISM="Pavlova sp., Strain CCMP459" /LENGTH=200 /DNA_ID=CAMNT_0027767625 /DNA_START=79 /DNA_END=681 /DNA_ORIENTATION=-
MAPARVPRPPGLLQMSALPSAQWGASGGGGERVLASAVCAGPRRHAGAGAHCALAAAKSLAARPGPRLIAQALTHSARAGVAGAGRRGLISPHPNPEFFTVSPGGACAVLVKRVRAPPGLALTPTRVDELDAVVEEDARVFELRAAYRLAIAVEGAGLKPSPSSRRSELAHHDDSVSARRRPEPAMGHARADGFIHLKAN